MISLMSVRMSVAQVCRRSCNKATWDVVKQSSLLFASLQVGWLDGFQAELLRAAASLENSCHQELVTRYSFKKGSCHHIPSLTATHCDFCHNRCCSRIKSTLTYGVHHYRQSAQATAEAETSWLHAVQASHKLVVRKPHIVQRRRENEHEPVNSMQFKQATKLLCRKRYTNKCIFVWCQVF